MCSVVYNTEFCGKCSILCQERGGAIGVSGPHDVVYYASLAFDVCLRVLEYLKLRCGGPPVVRTSESVTQAYWKWTELRLEGDVLKDEMDVFKSRPAGGEVKPILDARYNHRLQTIDNCRASFLTSVSALAHLVMFIAEPGDPVSECMETRFLAATLTRTSKFGASIGGPNVTSVFACPIAEQRVLAQGPMSSRPRIESMPGANKQLRRQLLERKSRQWRQRRRRWIRRF